jgi:hypothetical protein
MKIKQQEHRANVNINVRSAGINDGFAFVWRGHVNIPAAETMCLKRI